MAKGRLTSSDRLCRTAIWYYGNNCWTVRKLSELTGFLVRDILSVIQKNPQDYQENKGKISTYQVKNPEKYLIPENN